MDFSLILKTLDDVCIKILRLLKLGKIFQHLQNLYSWMIQIYQVSLVGGSISNLSKFLQTQMAMSKIIALFKRRSLFTNVWETSFVYYMLELTTNVFWEKMHQKLASQVWFYKSFLIRIIKKLFQHFEILLGAILILIAIVPDQYWYNIYTLILMIGLFSLFMLKKLLIHDSTLQWKGLDPIFLLYFVVVGCSYVFSLAPSMSARFVGFHATGFLIVLLIVSSIHSIQSFKTVLRLFLVGVSLTSVYGIWQVITDSVPFDPSLTDVDGNQGLPGRIFSTMANPNNYAELLIITLPWMLAAMFNSRHMIGKLIYFSMASMSFFALLYTGSRSAWLGCLLSVFIFLWMKRPSWIPGIVVFVICSIPIWPDFVIKRFTTILEISQDSSAMYRVKIFNTVWPVIQEYWISGIGLGTDVFMRITANYHIFTTKIPVHTHILYTQMLLEIGIIGLVLFVWLMVRLFKTSAVLARQLQNSTDSNYLIAGISSISGILLISFVEYVWYYPRVMFFFWVGVGLITAYIQIAKQKTNMNINT